MTELLPCPFCGGPADFERKGTARQSCIIACGDCGCRLESNEVWNSGNAWNHREAITAQAAGTGKLAQRPDESDGDYIDRLLSEAYERAVSPSQSALGADTPVTVAQRERPAFLNSLKKTAKVMRSAHDKGGDRLMSIWTEDVQGVEEAIEFLEGCATTEESRG